MLLIKKFARQYSTHISKVLVANRGEIACRVVRTAKKLGIKTVAVYSDADINALHVSLADEAYHIGSAAASASYLRSEKILSVAKTSGCEAVHPGYGFLSENAEFAEECAKEGIIFVGPPAPAIRSMGSKSVSKKLMEAAGVPVVKGYHGDDQSDARLRSEADRIGYPVMLKAVKGGGGKGMRMVMDPSEFSVQLASARNEALKAFGDSTMLVEAFVQRPRHVEVQIFGDTHGNYVHIGERDCSVQRRHQKVLEEAPAPELPDNVRLPLCDAAVKAARAVGYVGAGTVEFIVDAASLEYSFMEMNTRLQVEHPVTEMVSGLDLVEWQLKVAAGEKLPLRQDEIMANGHSFEARIYAEDPEAGFLPQAGCLKYFSLPKGDHVRIDTGVRQGDEVPVFYDPMIAKLIVWGPNRTLALNKLRESLAHFHVGGVSTNINFLLKATSHKEFSCGRVDTGFISDHESELLASEPLKDQTLAVTIPALLYSELKNRDRNDPFYANAGFKVNQRATRVLNLTFQGELLSISVEYLPNNKFKFRSLGDSNRDLTVTACIEERGNGALLVRSLMDGINVEATAVVSKEGIQIFTENGVQTVEIPLPTYETLIDEDDTRELGAASPMPGVVDQVLVSVNDIVKKGQALITVIAMKMEYTIRAPHDGIIAEIVHQPGDSVTKGTSLVRFQTPQ